MMIDSTHSPTAVETEDNWRVAVFAVPEDVEALKRIIRRDLHQTSIDVQIQLYRLPGLLPERLTQAAAEHLAQRIEQLGVATDVVDERSLPQLDRAETVHHVRCLDEGLELIGLDGSRERLESWDALVLISIGYVPLETKHHYEPPRTAIGSAPHHRGASLVTASLAGPEAWLVCLDDSTETVYRIDHNLMNYEYLATLKSDSASANFRLFAEDMCRRAAGTFQTPATRAFLAGDHLANYCFDSSTELRRETLFYDLLRRRMEQ